MNRTLLRSGAFTRAVKRLVKKHPEMATSLAATLGRLSSDAFDPALKTHKLSGELADSWACSAGYDLRIIFSFVAQNDHEAILLETIGTHDEVY